MSNNNHLLFSKFHIDAHIMYKWEHLHQNIQLHNHCFLISCYIYLGKNFKFYQFGVGPLFVSLHVRQFVVDVIHVAHL